MNAEILKKAKELRHELHMNPDLSNQERPTFDRIIAFLKANTKNIEIVDKGHYIYAVYRSKDPKKTPLGFRADVDAILVYDDIDKPYKSCKDGIGHKCGHDGHAATQAAFILDVDEKGADRDLYFIFQPAEENGTGSASCAEEFIKDNNIPEVFAFHSQSCGPRHAMGVRDGLICCASKGMTITMTGKPAHASQPENGINPSEAISKTALNVSKLSDQKDYKGLVLATIVQIDVGEKEAFGVAASKGKLLITIRGEIEDEMDELQAKLEAEAKKNAAEYGLSCEFSYCDSFPETICFKESNDKVRAACKNLGYEIYEMPFFFRGSEDFGHFTKYAKGTIFFTSFGNDEDIINVHTSHFDFDDEFIEMVGNIYEEIIKMD